MASRVILSKQSAQSARGSVIQRSDHDQRSNHNFCQAEYVHGFVNTNIAVVALWHRNGPISTTETRANRCPNGNGERLLLPEAQRAAGIGAAQDLLQDLQAPHRVVAPDSMATTREPPVRILTSPGIPKRAR